MHKLALVVDDSRVARLTLNKLLTKQQFDVQEYASAEELMAYLQAAPALPDIIFMDVMMEAMDGITATRQLKAIDKFANIPIVICTGNSDDVNDELAVSAGASSVLSKPPQQEALHAILTKVQATAPKQHTPSADKSGMVEKVVSSIEQKLLPKLRQESHQLVSDSIEKALPTLLNAELDRLKTSLNEQLSAQLISSCEQELKVIAERTLGELISQKLPSEMQQAVVNLDLTKQVSEALVSSTQPWLAEQEQQLKQQIVVSLKPEVEKMVEDFLEKSIAAMVAPLVTLQVKEQLAQQDQSSKTDELAQRVTQLNRTVMGLGVIVFILAVLVFI